MARPPRSLLTRRRAVDFCRVATAQCRVSPGSSLPSAPQSCGAASWPSSSARPAAARARAGCRG